ncbi:DNA primase [Erwinia phage vB_EamP-S6]|uniref:Gp072 n=1 Tax=Erwinia phage vB_EamP-S6 TaxID=1051675 RepID=G0YQG4_9CAUD|nr:DNA primase [Erwinia phage vB_EamP-S6]AEJ81591.1 gp072 [Erwinia phage vB_EamP-S6]
MRDLSAVNPHPAIEEIVDVLCNKIQNNDRPLFRVVVAYFLAKMASSMRTVVLTKDRGEVPVNCYALLTAVSGSGKGYGINIMEDEFLKGFKDRFMADTFPIISETSLVKLADERALRSGKTPDEELDKAQREFKALGALAFTFDSGTPAAIKQMRQKLLMGEIGSINLQIDEIGSNLINSTDVLNVFLELYDQGQTKQKLTKNTAENQRAEELDGKTPANMLLFGTPSKLLDGAKTEDEFYSFLETGYARRCLFANGSRKRAAETLTPAEIYHRLSHSTNQGTIDKWADHFRLLADPTKYKWEVVQDDLVGIEMLTYKIECEAAADLLPEHEDVKKAELSHRYMKALKLAGALAFIDESTDLTMTHALQAIKMVEESGAAFQQLLNREKSYVKLAKYLAGAGQEVTHADLNIALPFYKTGAGARNEQMSLAMAWGYKNNIIIKKSYVEGIEFFAGETLKETDLDKMVISYSNHVAYRYLSEEAPFSKMAQLFGAPGYHWVNHGLVRGKNGEGHRDGTNVLPGFNMLVLDIDSGIPLATAQELMKEFTFITYTTKRHQQPGYGDRFRMVLPMKYTLKLDEDEFSEFMQNVFSWLPFEVDDETAQRCRKWESNPGTIDSNEGVLFDPLRFIPKTSKNEEFKRSRTELESLDNIERWFAERMVSGSRNNHLLKFAMMLKDAGQQYAEVEQRVREFNAKLSNRLPEDEIERTIIRSLAKAYSNP